MESVRGTPYSIQTISEGDDIIDDINFFEGSSETMNPGNDFQIGVESHESRQGSEIYARYEGLHSKLLKDLERANKNKTKRDTDSEGTSSIRVGTGYHLRKSIDSLPGSLRRLASNYMRERQSLLETVISVMKNLDDGDEAGNHNQRQIASERQMQIWTDIATDLDGYYLEMLNKHLRRGSMQSAEMKRGTLLKHRLSESIVNDLNRSKNMNIFSSREDIHDDIVYGQFQEQFCADDSKVENLMYGLLLRTNERRKFAVGFHEAQHHNENEAESTTRERDGPLIGDRIQQLMKKIRNFEANKATQQDELESKSKLILGLKADNMKLMEALDVFSEYTTKTEKRREEEIRSVVEDYKEKLREQQNRIVELRSKLGEREEDLTGGKEGLIPEKAVSKCNKNVDQFDANFCKLAKCFEEAYNQLQQLAGSGLKRGRKDKGNNMGDLKHITFKQLQGEPGKIIFSQTIENIDPFEYLCKFVPERLLQLCEVNEIPANIYPSRNDESAESLKNYIDDLIGLLLESANTRNQEMRKFETLADAKCKDLKKVKQQYMKLKHALESILSEKEDWDAKIAEKDEKIANQESLLKERDREIQELRSQSEVLLEDLKLALDSFNPEICRLGLVEKRLSHPLFMKKEESGDSEWLFELMVENNVEETLNETTNCDTCRLKEFCVRCMTKQLPFD